MAVATEPLWSRRLAALPWVRRYTKRHNKRQCDGIRWNSVPLKALWKMNSKHEWDRELLAKYRCKKTAQWQYRFLTEKHLADHSCTKTLYLCHSHVWSYRGMEEDRRLDRWVARNPDKWPKRPEA